MRYCLIADDNPAMRKVLRGFLTELGFETSEAANGREALDSCRARAPDAVLLDWNMPVLDGFGFLDALRSGEAATPKVIFCTSGAEAAPVIRAMAAGASEYLVKPFDKDVLASKFALLGLS
jgi:two-component system chemotaxis response regulator CheY